MPLKPSELILNKDGSIYHLNLLPHQISDTIITVGDPQRVSRVSKHFDQIEHRVEKREFITHTGVYKGKRLSVISTGIGTDNIDIVLNELDALANINLKSRLVNEDLKALNIIRVGTSGALQSDIPVDSLVISSHGIGMDGLIHFYGHHGQMDEVLSNHFADTCNIDTLHPMPYAAEVDEKLFKHFKSKEVLSGMTLTNVGFYGPQGRSLRLKLSDESLNERITNFNYNGLKVTNFEMETSAIYGLSKLLGHKAISLNAIIANRITGDFSKKAGKTMNRLIEYTLKKIVNL
ncbi:nucleoside phosphorylase [Aegicerativicinus sediminis]|uniref:nucleoside phosphorylase n=1 Tax=Aegicerativicinus sediminis TaxID=2893202 RepID=UPI001E6567FA|nr:nucleoside phosphorylase [Aegicerativicinus sediminis]